VSRTAPAARLGALLQRRAPLSRLAASIALIAGAFLLIPGPAARAMPMPVDCTGYAQPRVFLETQAWWEPSPGAVGKNNFGHLHLGTCFPYKQTLTGKVDFDIRVTMHNNPGKAYLLRLMTEDTVLYQGTVNDTCTVPGDCVFWHHITADTSKASHDGRNEFRFSVKLDEPDGRVQFESSGWQTYLKNGKTSKNYRSSDLTIARGWYTGALYTNAELDSDIPLAPVKGTWSPTVKMAAGAGGIPVTHSGLYVDPDFHMGDPGWVVKDVNSSFKGTVSIDTTKLMNGPHRLLIKADADCKNGNCGTAALDGQRNSGVQVIWFNVAN